MLQAVREWEKTKAPYRGKKTADVIAELIAAKRREQISVPYVENPAKDIHRRGIFRTVEFRTYRHGACLLHDAARNSTHEAEVRNRALRPLGAYSIRLWEWDRVQEQFALLGVGNDAHSICEEFFRPGVFPTTDSEKSGPIFDRPAFLPADISAVETPRR